MDDARLRAERARTGARRVADMDPLQGDRSPTSTLFLRDSFAPRDDERADNRSIALENARRIYSRRMFRRQLIGVPTLFGEPAWEMLIDLFIHRCEGKKIATSALCVVSCIPPSSALRLIHKLCEAQLLIRIADPDDGRRHFVELTPQTAQRLQTYFCAQDM